MTVLRTINHLFVSFGWEAVVSTRGMLTHYQPWSGDARISPQAMSEAAASVEDSPTLSVDDGLTNVIPNATASAVPTSNPMAALINKYGKWGIRALEQEGYSRRTINSVGQHLRRLGRNSGGMGEVLGIWNQVATSGAFEFRKSTEVARFTHRLSSSAMLQSCSDINHYISKAQPFYTDVEKFTIALAMSISGMPERESGKFAIAFAFDQNAIPVLEETDRYFNS
ncbi:hypothetical protein [Tritonibacter scottomollicae]|uniref:Uncharacterized protein n=1 Tax=Tritonibacter scottomollicae TaxID=483013 RepID=A0A2T1AKX5_TRISK|nr:hypothetical protein [Tritonibacter scottomollicae]PRZ49265.1 hypothetical protein CLV89_1026 [Tritonibacter scottomollicae]